MVHDGRGLRPSQWRHPARARVPLPASLRAQGPWEPWLAAHTHQPPHGPTAAEALAGPVDLGVTETTTGGWQRHGDALHPQEARRPELASGERGLSHPTALGALVRASLKTRTPWFFQVLAFPAPSHLPARLTRPHPPCPPTEAAASRWSEERQAGASRPLCPRHGVRHPNLSLHTSKPGAYNPDRLTPESS